MFLLQNNVCNSFPLFLCWVYTGWVVSTCVNKENRVLGCGFERRKEACKVEADSLGVVVWIVYWLNTNVLQDGLVIGYFDNILFIRKQKLGQLRSGVINM